MAKKSATKPKRSHPNAKAIEDVHNIIALLSGQLADGLEPESPLEAAQDLMFDAWETRSAKTRIAMAREALEISPLCAEAYALLAREAAKTDEEKISLCRQAVAAGEEALGKQTFKQDAGMFWGLIETRPYMRALHALAEILWDNSAHEEAIAKMQEMLHLNPNDNQGVRYELLDHLIERGRDGEADSLIKRYKDDSWAGWAYGRALLQFRKSGDTAKSRSLLQKAFECNPYVAEFLTGAKPMPRKLPDFYSGGDVNEAVIYALSGKAVWAASEGATEWLKIWHRPLNRDMK
jgi:tetratricopeptide (TPR) repeat protein